jgi:hypothetical protein
MTDPVRSDKIAKNSVASNPPKVLISYSHDSPEHEQRVLALANQLRAHGVDAWIDQYRADPDEGWISWMRDRIGWADRVLLVFTETYERRFLGKEAPSKGLGATFEGIIISQALYESGIHNAKFRPVVFRGEDERFIPEELRRVNRYRVYTPEGYQRLLWWLHDKQVEPPMVGPTPDFSQVRTKFFPPDSFEPKPDALSVKYNETMLDDLARVLAEIRSKRVLFADLDDELWMYVFESLKQILSGLVSTNGTIQRKGPNDVKQCVEELISATAAYLANYEADYVRFMEGPWLPDLAEVHKERNWPAMGDAGEDLIRLRRIFGRALKNLAAFAHEGKILPWTEEESDAVQDSFRAERWAENARCRKLCEACGWDLNYRRAKCPYNHSMCPSFDPSETAFECTAFGAREVQVAGSFSGWQPISLETLEWGRWGVRVRIQPGIYQYKFIVDGAWQTDPMAPVERDGAGNMNSVLFVRDS